MEIAEKLKIFLLQDIGLNNNRICLKKNRFVAVTIKFVKISESNVFERTTQKTLEKQFREVSLRLFAKQIV